MRICCGSNGRGCCNGVVGSGGPIVVTRRGTDRTVSANTQNLLECFKAFGFEGPIAQQVAESILGMSPRARSNEEMVAKALWPIFEPYIRQLCAQTAHVQLARVLLYRVGEDESVFDEYLTGTALPEFCPRGRPAFLAGRILQRKRLNLSGAGCSRFSLQSISWASSTGGW